MLTRRSFLQLVGASLAVPTLHPTFSLLAAERFETYQGRALSALPVFTNRKAGTTPTAYLWPDSITTILDSDDDWYQVIGGWVRRYGLQPMLPFESGAYQFKQDVPFWAEVAAPVAPVRAYCAADAPLVTRIGHGGVSRVIDALPGEPNGWYGIADQTGSLLGWTQGVFWRPVDIEIQAADNRWLRLDRKQALMTAYDGKQQVLKVPFSAQAGLQVGDFAIQRGEIGGTQWRERYESKIYEGVSWETRFGNGQTISGVYWHNLFGQVVNAGPTVQTTPLIARWLYGWLGDNAHVLVE